MLLLVILGQMIRKITKNMIKKDGKNKWKKIRNFRLIGLN